MTAHRRNHCRSAIAVTLFLVTLLQSSMAMAQLWLSENDNVQMTLHMRMFPVNLLYQQQTRYGTVQIKNQTFQDELGKYELFMIDSPAEDSRTPSQRLDARIASLQSSDEIIIGSVDHNRSTDLPGVAVRYFDGLRDYQQFVYVDGRREYLFRAESFEPSDHDLVQQNLAKMAESFSLATAPAAYYDRWNANRMDAAFTPELWPDWFVVARDSLTHFLSQSTGCADVQPATPSQLIVEVSPDGLVEEAWSNPRGKLGRCLELTLIGLQLPPPPGDQSLQLHLMDP